MLKLSLTELALATLFSSAGLARMLRQAILEPHRAAHREQFDTECKKALVSSLDEDYPRSFRSGDMQAAFDAIWSATRPAGRAMQEMPYLDHLYERLFTESGDLIHYRDGQVQNYARFSARIDPTLLVAYRLARLVCQRPYLQPHDLERIIGIQQPFFSPRPSSDDAVAENHAHIGGSHHAGLALAEHLFRDQPMPASECRHEDPQIFFQLVNLSRSLLSRSDLMSVKNEGSDTEEKFLDKALGPGAEFQMPSPLPWSMLCDQSVEARTDNPYWIRRQIAHSLTGGDLDRAWTWFLLGLWLHYLSPHCSTRLRMAILYLFIGLMRVRRDLIMDGRGLSLFVEYYGRPRRDMVSQIEIGRARTLLQGENDFAELKAGHSVLTPEFVGQWLGNLARSAGVPTADGVRPWREQDIAGYRRLMDRWHFCVHFFRRPDTRNNPHAAWRFAENIRNFLDTQTGWDHPKLLGDADVKALRLDPTRWLRGLDVAGDENLVKIEIFAPVLRSLRSEQMHKQQDAVATDGFHLSIHTGEDYAHPLSGMRHIDETVRFCEMRAGDRLGHALALGISAHRWMATHGEMLLPVDEHLDNLVWAWHHASTMTAHCTQASEVLPLLERRIHLLLPFVPWAHQCCPNIASPLGATGAPPQPCLSEAGFQALTPEILHAAWHLRRNCSYQLGQIESSGIPLTKAKMDAAVPDWAEFSPASAREELSRSASKAAVRLYRARWNWLRRQKSGESAPGAGCHSSSKRIHLVRVRHEGIAFDRTTILPESDPRTGMIEDTITEAEIEFVDALQDWLLDDYDKRGLAIEANPTSNVYIANLDKHAEHPIFRWYPPSQKWLKPGKKFNRFGLRRGPIRVCVNTDDAGIMPTTLRTEFALLREAALELGITRTDAEAWLEQLRQFGHEEFHRKHRPVWVPGPRRFA